MNQKAVKFFLAFLFFTASAWAPPLYAGQLININSADKAALATLNGIGEVYAQRIIDYRTQNGPFATIEDIVKVSGIGVSTFNKIKAYITVSDTDTAQTVPIVSTPLPPATKKVAPAATKSAAQTATLAAGSVPPDDRGAAPALWLSLGALAALLAAGVAGVWYLQAGAAKKEETTLTAEEFDIE